MADEADDAGAGAAPAQAGAWVDPYRGFNFKLEIQGVTEGHFVQCSGLGVRVDVISHKEGGNNAVTHKIPGAVSYDDVSLHYGLTKSTELWEWLQKIVQGQVDRRNASIVMLEPDGNTEALRWNLINAWPSVWRGAPLDATGSELAIESMTLVFEGLERG
jgi:phage tail-like protein